MFKGKWAAKKEVVGAGADNSVSRQVEGEHFRLIVENSRDMIFTMNLKGEFIFVSPSSKEFLGYDPAELQGLTFQSIVHPDDISACKESLRKNIENGERTPGFEYRVKDRSGNWHWHISSGSVVLAADGSFLHFLGVAKDITERKKVEAALRASEHKYRTLIDTLQEGVWAIDKEGLTTYANTCMAQMLGYTPDEMLGRPLFSFMSESQVTVARANMERRAQGIREQHDFEFLKKDGSPIYVLLEAGPLTDEGGNYIGAIAGVTDITERKKVEAALWESEERFTKLFVEAPLGVALIDSLTGHIYEVNPAFAHIAGRTMEEMVQIDWMDITHPDDIQEDLDNMALLNAGKINGFQMEKRYLHHDGTAVWINMTIAPVKVEDTAHPRHLCMIEDITERKKSEEALRQSENRIKVKLDAIISPVGDIGKLELADIVDTQAIQLLMDDFYKLTNIGMSVIDLKGKVLVATGWQDICTQFHRIHPETCKNCIESDTLLSQEVDEGTYKVYKCKNNMWDMVTPIKVGGKQIGNLFLGQFLFEDESPDYDIFRSQAQQYGFKEEDYIAALEQVPRWNRVTVDTVMAFYTKFAHLISSLSYSSMKLARSLAENERTLAALKESEEKYRLLADNMKDTIWLMDMNLKPMYQSPSAVKLRGFTLDELKELTLEQNLTPESVKVATEVFLQEMARVEADPDYKFLGDLELEFYRKDGTTFWSENTFTVMRDSSGKPIAVMGVARDITESKRLEEAQLRVEKLESVGLLAGGIAHNFNNLLTVILGNISLARTEAEPGSELIESLESAEKASLRAKELTVQLLTFSKGGAPVKKLGSLTELLHDTTGFALSGTNVKCRFSIPADLWHAEIDAGQVSQVIRNLVNNAQQAMPEGGTIELTAENLALSEKQILGRGLPLKAGNYVRVAVTDHGSGIPKEHLEIIFDPFFSTKPAGTGMALATSFSIARQHGGHLSVESEPGSGSTFYLYLPTSVKTHAAKQDKKEVPGRTGESRILVMDDEKEIRDVAGRMLKHIGYADVEFAADGAEAIKLYKAAMESGNPFSLAILDLTVPGGIGGEVAIRKLLEIDPGIKAIVSSGYIDDPVMARYGEYGFSGVVTKPYTIAELRKAVQAVISLGAN